MFCRNCGKQIPENSNVCQYCGAILQKNDLSSSFNSKFEKKKKPWKIVISAVAVAVAVATIVSATSCMNTGENAENQKLIEILEASTDKPVVEFFCEDYDGDGITEAYAVAGEEKETDNGIGYDNAEIYFVNQTEAEVIKQSVNGYANGIIETDDRMYVSFEVYDDKTQKGLSFIYSADGNESVEADISGKYSNVHQADGEILATDADGNEINVEISTTENDKKVTYLEATDEDWENFNEFLTETCGGHCYFDRNSENALIESMNFITKAGAYGYFFGDKGVECWTDSYFDDDKGHFVFPDASEKIGSISSEGYYLAKYPADKFDWIVKNVFGLEPDRNESGQNYLYEDDFLCYVYGDGIPPYLLFETEHEELSDGRYKIKSDAYSDYGENFYTIRGVVGLKEVDGVRVWEISKFDVVEEYETETETEIDKKEEKEEELTADNVYGKYTVEWEDGVPEYFILYDNNTFDFEFNYLEGMYKYSGTYTFNGKDLILTPDDEPLSSGISVKTFSFTDEGDFMYTGKSEYMRTNGYIFKKTN